MEEGQTQQPQNLLSERTCGFESHPPHQSDLPRPICRVRPPDPISCVDDRGLGAAYVYLLGLYLGDGLVSRSPKDVWKLRIFQDARYARLIESCAVP